MHDLASLQYYFVFRYQPIPQLVTRLNELHHQHRILNKRLQRMTAKIAERTEVEGITLDQDTHDDILGMMKSSEVLQFFENLPEDSFRQLFWSQQLKAASLKNARNMKWHPLMIRWALSLRHRYIMSTCRPCYSAPCIHRSSGAYELLRESGCIKLPTQRTLRDYTYHVEASTGFSSKVDQMLMTAANVGSCCERDKMVILLMDEMHIREDLVFDKHSGKLIGFANLGKCAEHA